MMKSNKEKLSHIQKLTCDHIQILSSQKNSNSEDALKKQYEQTQQNSSQRSQKTPKILKNHLSSSLSDKISKEFQKKQEKQSENETSSEQKKLQINPQEALNLTKNNNREIMPLNEIVNKEHQSKKQIEKKVDWKKYFSEQFCFQIKNISLMSKSYYKAVIFDINQVLLTFGKPENFSRELYEKIFRSQAWKSYLIGQQCQEKAYKLISIEIGVEVSLISDSLSSARQNLAPIQNGVALLAKLKKMGVKTVALSNCPRQELSIVCHRFAFFQDFDIILGSGMIGFQKPKKEAFLTMLKYVGVNPEEIIYLDDKIENIKMAKQLGIQSIQCNNDSCFTEVERRIDRSTELKIKQSGNNLSRAYHYLTKLADFDKYGFYQCITGKGTDINKPKKSSQIFCSASILTYLSQIALSSVGIKMLKRIKQMGVDHKYKFFTDLNVIPADVDTTSIITALLFQHKLIQKPIVDKIVDQIFLLHDKDKVYSTFFCENRKRCCPIVCCNALYLIHIAKRQKDSETVQKTKQFIMNFLVKNEYLKGCTFYPNPCLFLFHLAKLIENFSLDFQQFRDPLIKAIKQVIKQKAVDNLSLSLRCILSILYDIENQEDYTALLSAQLEDGSWKQSPLYSTSSDSVQNRYYWASRSYDTALGLKAIEMKIFGKGKFRIYS